MNVRLLPVVQDFFQAVRTVLREEEINLPFVIMQSDGSLVSEPYSSRFSCAKGERDTLACKSTCSDHGYLCFISSGFNS